MRGTASAGDDDPHASFSGRAAVIHHVKRSPMGGDHAQGRVHAEFYERIGGFLHDRQIRFAAHDDLNGSASPPDAVSS